MSVVTKSEAGDGTLLSTPIVGHMMVSGKPIFSAVRDCGKCRKAQVKIFSHAQDPYFLPPEPPPDPKVRDFRRDKDKNLYKDTPWIVRPICLTCWWMSGMEPASIQLRGMNRPPTTRDAVMSEVHRFDGIASDPYPEMARALRTLAETMPGPPPAPPFPAGNVRRSANALAMVGIDKLLEMLDRHVGGDFGMHGHAADAVESDAARWCPFAFNVPTRNEAAIRDGMGTVESRYLVEGKPNESIRVLTVHRPGITPETILISASRDTFRSYWE